MNEFGDAGGEQYDATRHDPERRNESTFSRFRRKITIAHRRHGSDIVIEKSDDLSDFAGLKTPDQFGRDRIMNDQDGKQRPPRQPDELRVERLEYVRDANWLHYCDALLH